MESLLFMNFLLPHNRAKPSPTAGVSETTASEQEQEEEPLEEDLMREAYDPSDPKHPDYLDRAQRLVDYWKDE